jgi:predicted amidohydrolase
MMKVKSLLFACLVVSIAASLPFYSPNSYTAAVVQYYPYPLLYNSSLRYNPQSIIQANLAQYELIVAEAAHSSVDLIVFPEYGLGNIIALYNNTPAAMKEYCENIKIQHNPCQQADQANIQLYTISCLARKYSMGIVINLCTSSSNSSLYNTDVIFDIDGSIVARYYKSHLFGESAVFIAPRPIQPVSFHFSHIPAKFGVFTCFDIDFAEPINQLLGSGIKNFIYPSWWVNQPPQLNAVLLQQAWSRIHSVNLLAANTLKPSGAGGGIFSNGQILSSYYNPTATYSKQSYHINIAEVPLDPLTTAPISKPIPKLQLLHTHSSIAFNCLIESINLEGECVHLSPSLHPSLYSLSSGGVQCEAQVAFAGSLDYVLFASSSSLQFPLTPASLTFQSCFILQCKSSQQRGTAHCAPITTSSALFIHLQLFAAFNSSLYSIPVNQVYPILAVRSAAPTLPTALHFVPLHDSGEKSYYSLALKNSLNTSLYSAGLYAVAATDQQYAAL